MTTEDIVSELKMLRETIERVLGNPLGLEQDLITIKEAEKITKFSARTIQRWLASGHLKAMKSPAGKGVRISRKELLAVLQEERGVRWHDTAR